MLQGRRPVGTIAWMAGVPATLTAFTRSWGKLIAYTYEHVLEPNECVHIDDDPVSFHSHARNGLVSRMLGDWLLMLDADHDHPPDLLGRLLHRMNQHDLDVVCGVYQFKHPPFAPVIYGWMSTDKDDASKGGFAPIGKFDEGSPLHTVAGAGGGCLLVKRRVFDRIRDELGERPFDLRGQMGEDLSFFWRLRKLGIKCWCDLRVECPHLLVKRVEMSDWERPSEGELVRVENDESMVGA